MANWRIQFVALLLLSAGSVQGYGLEMAQLHNGRSLACDRHREMGEFTRLFLDGGESSFVDIPTADIAGYQAMAAPQATRISPGTPRAISEHIARASRATGIDEDLIASVIQAESGNNPKAISPKGAQGLMQLMPGTAEKLGVGDAFDPAANIDGGSRYLRELLERFNGDAAMALAAYNAGPARVDKYQGVPPYRETRNYVKRVIDEFNRRKLSAAATPSQQQPGDAGSEAHEAE